MPRPASWIVTPGYAAEGELSPALAEMLGIVAVAEAGGAPFTGREIAEVLGITHDTSLMRLLALERRGAATRIHVATQLSATTPVEPGPAPSAPPASVLTARQTAVLQVITATTQRQGYPPSLREIGQAVGLTSTSSVWRHVIALADMGLLRRDPLRPRAFVPVGRNEPENSVPFCTGYATVPVVERSETGVEPTKSSIHVPMRSTGRGNLAAFTMPDGSMAGLGIMPGDTMVVHCDAAPAVGDLSLVLLPGWRSTVRKVTHNPDGQPVLSSGSPVFHDLPADTPGLSLGGRVVTVMRSTLASDPGRRNGPPTTCGADAEN